MNVILATFQDYAPHIEGRAYMEENTPGTLIFVTGSDESQRSGTHSRASDPQIAVLRLTADIPTNTMVSFGITTSVKVQPLLDLIGCDNGSTSSCRQLVAYETIPAVICLEMRTNVILLGRVGNCMVFQFQFVLRNG